MESLACAEGFCMHYTADHFSQRLLQGVDRRIRHKGRQSSETSCQRFDRFVLALSDQQLMTGLGILIAAYDMRCSNVLLPLSNCFRTRLVIVDDASVNSIGTTRVSDRAPKASKLVGDGYALYACHVDSRSDCSSV